jgi:ribosomal protein S18 acetylase RimI-like enzyme
MVSVPPIRIRAYLDGDFERVVALWHACGLLRPWNEPADDIALCHRTASSELFVGLTGDDDAASMLGATVMTGSDGHRGWMYYLAVDPALRRKGFARAMVHHAEHWLATLGIRKVELMIRDDNEAVRSFYEKIGYAVEPRMIMSRWLADK